MSNWPISIWITRDDAERSKTCDPLEVDDAKYVHEAQLTDAITERNSWRDIAVRLMEEKHEEEGK